MSFYAVAVCPKVTYKGIQSNYTISLLQANQKVPHVTLDRSEFAALGVVTQQLTYTYYTNCPRSLTSQSLSSTCVRAAVVSLSGGLLSAPCPPLTGSVIGTVKLTEDHRGYREINANVHHVYFMLLTKQSYQFLNSLVS